MKRFADGAVGKQNFLVDLPLLATCGAWRLAPGASLTHEPSATLVTRGEYWETGKLGPFPPGTGDPNPLMPETLYRLLPPLGYG